MGVLCRRKLFLALCSIQLISTAWRQIFDFLGFMWAPILANFFNILFAIFGFFGGYQRSANYLIVYTIWNVVWCCWNIFVACFYLNVGVLNRDSDVLSLGTGSVSWWESNGPGCKATFVANLSTLEESSPWRPPRPDSVAGCLLPFHHVEVLQALLHTLLAMLGVFMVTPVSRLLQDEDFCGGKNKKVGSRTMPLYSIEYSSATNNNTKDYSCHEALDESEQRLASPTRPMTPRRVKRRSHSSGHTVRGTAPALPPPYQHRHSHPTTTPLRSSTRSRSRTRTHHNPVLRLIEQQHRAGGSGHCNPLFGGGAEQDRESERPPSVRSSYSNYHGSRVGVRNPLPLDSHGPPAYRLHSKNRASSSVGGGLE